MTQLQLNYEFLPILKNYSLQTQELKRKIDGIRKAKGFCEYLDQHNIYYDVCIKHQEVLGCEESINYYQRFKEYIDKYTVCKNLLVHERKGEKRNYLIITDSKKKLDLSSLKDAIGCKKLEFSSEEEMQQLLDTTPGNVSLFNMIYDKDKKIELVIDEELFNSSLLAFHPLYNGMSLFIKPEECLKFVSLIERDAKIIPIEEKKSQKILKKI